MDSFAKRLFFNFQRILVFLRIGIGGKTANNQDRTGENNPREKESRVREMINFFCEKRHFLRRAFF